MATQSTSVPAFPLQWPVGVPRTASNRRQHSRFGNFNWDRSLKGLRRELAMLGASYVTISTNQKIRQDGEPYAQQRSLDDPGVAVYFTLEGLQVCFPCDRWLTLAENLRAITLHIESIRGQQRWGVGTSKQAFAGYKALTAVAGEDEDPFAVLGLKRETSTEAQIVAAHRDAAKRAHPDVGGSSEQMARINRARDRALAAIRVWR